MRSTRPLSAWLIQKAVPAHGALLYRQSRFYLHFDRDTTRRQSGVLLFKKGRSVISALAFGSAHGADSAALCAVRRARVTCHDQRLKTAGLTRDTADVARYLPGFAAELRPAPHKPHRIRQRRPRPVRDAWRLHAMPAFRPDGLNHTDIAQSGSSVLMAAPKVLLQADLARALARTAGYQSLRFAALLPSSETRDWPAGVTCTALARKMSFALTAFP